MVLDIEQDPVNAKVTGSAIEVHKHLGPGLLESAHEECLAFELRQQGIDFQRQVLLPILYKGIQLDCAYRMDLVVERYLIIEIKTVEQLLPIHQAQLLTYLKLSDLKFGLLLNFNVALLRDGIKRMIL